MTDESPKQSIWSKLGSFFSSPASALSDASKHSPVLTVLAIMFVIQPVVQTGIELIKEVVEVRQDLDPATRPITKAELDLVNQKIDFNNQLILADINADKEKALAFANHRGVDKANEPLDHQTYDALQQKLTTVQQNLDDKFKARKK